MGLALHHWRSFEVVANCNYQNLLVHKENQSRFQLQVPGKLTFAQWDGKMQWLILLIAATINKREFRYEFPIRATKMSVSIWSYAPAPNNQPTTGCSHGTGMLNGNTQPLQVQTAWPPRADLLTIIDEHRQRGGEEVAFLERTRRHSNNDMTCRCVEDPPLIRCGFAGRKWGFWASWLVYQRVISIGRNRLPPKMRIIWWKDRNR